MSEVSAVLICAIVAILICVAFIVLNKIKDKHKENKVLKATIKVLNVIIRLILVVYFIGIALGLFIILVIPGIFIRAIIVVVIICGLVFITNKLLYRYGKIKHMRIAIITVRLVTGIILLIYLFAPLVNMANSFVYTNK